MKLFEALPPKEIWQLALPYWGSSERKKGYIALAILVGVVALGAGMVAWFTGFQKDFYNAIEQRNAEQFWKLATMIIGVAAATSMVGAIDQWLRQWLLINWRRHLTKDFVRRWLTDNAFYRLERRQLVDNADQRIADDIKLFIEIVLELALSFVGTMLTLILMGVILWKAATPMTIGPITIPGYLFFVAVTFGVTNVALVHWAGRRLAHLTFEQQHVEADFRFTLAQQRESAEQIALYNGGPVEGQRLGRLFDAIGMNWGFLMTNFFRMNFASSAVSSIAAFTPMFALAPKLFAGETDLGGMMQAQGAFLAVSASIAWFANSYAKLVQWSAVTQRLLGLSRSIAEPEATGVQVSTANQPTVETQDLHLALPNGTALAKIGSLSIRSGERWLVRGPSGIGKSTLLRAIAGIWPYGKGSISIPENLRSLFLPQKSYIPHGTLKEALCYPSPVDAFDDAACTQALHDTKLPHLTGELHKVARWHHRLSGGEQQRLAMARVLLIKPEVLFLDEATSALDIETETALHETLKAKLPNTTLVSIGHQPTLDRFHDHALDLKAGGTAVPSTLNAAV